jgi:alpha-L-fucosidase 2
MTSIQPILRLNKTLQTGQTQPDNPFMKFHFSLFRSIRAVFPTAVTLAFLIQSGPAAETPSLLTLFYTNAARNWNEALPLGNGRLGAMVFGTPGKERLQLNEESLWAGCPVEAWPPDFPKHLAEVRRLLFAGKKAEAQAYGVAHMTATPTSFRSYEPLADLWLDFGAMENVTGYRRELVLADGIARVTANPRR